MKREQSMRLPIVGVIGGNRQPSEVVAQAQAIGLAVVERSAILLTGGEPSAKPDVKDAAMNGAKRAAVARLVSILPSPTVSLSCEGHHLRLLTGLTSYERDAINGMTPDALVVLCGGAGTLCELAFAAVATKPIRFFRSVAMLRAMRDDRVQRAKLIEALNAACARYPLVSPKEALRELDACLRGTDEPGDEAAVVHAALAAVPAGLRESSFPGIPGHPDLAEHFDGCLRAISA
jgi:predicted Rossmann-fold nucleotide-binding protein